jgi:hypothetical protein
MLGLLSPFVPQRFTNPLASRQFDIRILIAREACGLALSLQLTTAWMISDHPERGKRGGKFLYSTYFYFNLRIGKMVTKRI